jgi:hypothetical protein
VQSVWHAVWKRAIRCAEAARGAGRGCRVGCGGLMLKASLGSPCWWLLLALWVERFALHGYPAAVGAACFGRVDCVLCFLVTRAVEEFTRKVEHVVYVGGGDCHAIVFDEKKSMCRGSMEDLLGSLFGRVGEVNDWYCCILVLGLRHLGTADKGICGWWAKIR